MDRVPRAIDPGDLVGEELGRSANPGDAQDPIVGEDVATGGLLALAIANPIAAAMIAALLVFLSIWLAIKARRAIKRVMDVLTPARPMKDVTPPSA